MHVLRVTMTCGERWNSVVSIFCVIIINKYAECLPCENLYCLHNVCKNEQCLHGCQEGFVNNSQGQCARICPQNCTECDQDVCNGCKPGFYGTQCAKTCKRCLLGSCERFTGKCNQGCAQGFQSSPFCNVSTEVVNVLYKYENAKSDKKLPPLDSEESVRIIYIWIAGAIIVSVMLSVVVIIVIVLYNRRNNNNKSEEMGMVGKQAYHLTSQDIED